MRQTLRAIVRKFGEKYEAQLLELDYAATSDTIDGLWKEIAHLMVTEYRASRDLGCTPFACVGEAPKELQDLWNAHTGIKGTLDLPDEVAFAVAVAAHVSQTNPRFEFVDLSKAA